MVLSHNSIKMLLNAQDSDLSIAKTKFIIMVEKNSTKKIPQKLLLDLPNLNLQNLFLGLSNLHPQKFAPLP